MNLFPIYHVAICHFCAFFSLHSFFLTDFAQLFCNVDEVNKVQGKLVHNMYIFKRSLGIMFVNINFYLHILLRILEQKECQFLVCACEKLLKGQHKIMMFCLFCKYVCFLHLTHEMDHATSQLIKGKEALAQTCLQKSTRLGCQILACGKHFLLVSDSEAACFSFVLFILDGVWKFLPQDGGYHKLATL